MAELLIVVAILTILFAVSVPQVVKIQKDLRQKELDAKAEIIYTAVQNKLIQMKAGGKNAVFQVGGNNVNPIAKDDKPADADENLEINDGDLCYFTSSSLNVVGSAAAAVMAKDTTDEMLRSNHWVIEYSPKSAIVYAVFYSEDMVNCADEYATNYAKYNSNNGLRYKSGRVADGAKVGYFGGGMIEIGSASTVLTPKLTINNAEKLTANITLVMPDGVSGYPVFKMTLEDITGKKFTRYYADVSCNSDYINKIQNEDDKCDFIVNTDINKSVLGNVYSLDIMLDDLSSPDTRFNKLYGENSSNAVKLKSGTPLKISVDAICPGSNLNTQSVTDIKITNSLFADTNSKEPSSPDSAPTLNIDYGSNEENAAVVQYGRHLQNLDSISGVVNTVEYVKQASNINFAQNSVQSGNENWYETYAGKSFKPINNTDIVSYDGKQYRISNLTVSTTSNAGLFETLTGGQTISNVVLTGANVKNNNNGSAAGALVGTISGNEISVNIENCQVFLTPSDINGKTNADIWVDGGIAGGLIGRVYVGTVNITSSAASTVVGGNSTTSVGGLIGQVDTGAHVNINKCYADSYLTGQTAGGLVGTSGGGVNITSAYAAGLASYSVNGAGIICGNATLSSVYTILYPNQLNNYYAVAAGGTASGNVYYAAASNTDTGLVCTPIGTFNIVDLTNNLGTDFSADTSGSVPYNLMGQTLSEYTYPVLKDITHYGDWNIGRPSWGNDSAVIDIFKDMKDTGYADKVFDLYLNGYTGIGTITTDNFVATKDALVNVECNKAAEGHYKVKVVALNVGDTTINFVKKNPDNTVEVLASLNLKITADIDIAAYKDDTQIENIILVKDQPDTITLKAVSVYDTSKQYHTNDNTTWDVKDKSGNDNIVKTTHGIAKNEWIVNRVGSGNTTLKADFSYNYNGVTINRSIEINVLPQTEITITVTYENGNPLASKVFFKTYTAGIHSLPTTADVTAETGFVPQGNTLAGWKVKGGDGTIYNPGDSYTFGIENVTFIAQWAKYRYKNVTEFEAGGSYVIAAVVKDESGNDTVNRIVLTLGVDDTIKATTGIQVATDGSVEYIVTEPTDPINNSMFWDYHEGGKLANGTKYLNQRGNSNNVIVGDSGSSNWKYEDSGIYVEGSNRYLNYSGVFYLNPNTKSTIYLYRKVPAVISPSNSDPEGESTIP